jgi:hypothetical protein
MARGCLVHLNGLAVIYLHRHERLRCLNWLSDLLLFDLLLLCAVDSEKYSIFVSKFSCNLVNCIFGEILIRLSQIYRSVRIRTVFSEPAHLVVFIKLALLRLVVVVRDIEQFKLHFYR